MEIGFSQAQAQRVLKQRNMLVLTSIGLGVVAMLALIAASARDRQVVLQPVLTRSIEISSARLGKDYLELVTRDATVLMLNRTPANAQYWMDSVLRIVHPSAYGRIKGELLRIVNDQRGSSVAQFFTIEAMKVDPEHLTSEVTGVLHTMVGRQEVAALKRTFRFDWSYTGVELRLVGFGAVSAPGAPVEAAAEAATAAPSTGTQP
ncbi:type IV conjugative transfer system protein TraE [Novosphingobium sp. MD-1]|uniref:type IV conjugative transfer system protein TraE n=1 Tax=Novosphingobium sp. MD-1 TaxID=1630648 RepID=UPI00061C55C2|nr:type IV conjugative transfer system protein TraE [Novosphingobium sp. MD-1]GAO52890.1 incF plasmid conjugative transfer pilus assembly protein traE [Novosphingobium sp. MD-1]